MPSLLPPEFGLLNEWIAMGWGETPRHLIPDDWRTRRGPDASFSRERKANIGAGIGRKRWGWGKRRKKVEQKKVRER